MDEDCNQNNLELRKLQLIDVFSEDDFLIASPLGDSLEDFRLSVVLENIDENETSKPENAAKILQQRERKSLLPESTEFRRESYLRKSLAWDSAFFTSAGVLDPEELVIINKGFEKVETHILSVNQDLLKQQSDDSESTLDSDGFSFESNQTIEVDLFQDIRASIQRSSMMSNDFKSGSPSAVGEACKQKTHSLKKPDVVSQNKVKSMPISKRQSIYTQGSGRSNKHAARSGKSNLLFPKPPKILGRMNPVSAGETKRDFMGAEHVKMETKTATSQFGQGKSKKSGSTSSIMSPKSPLSVSITASNDSTASCSSSGTASFKSSLNSRKKTDSRKNRLAGPISTSKTPLRCSLGGKSGLGNSGLSTHLISMTNHSSYESPASSIDGWSSESSSASLNQGSNCLDSSFGTKGACLGDDANPGLNWQSYSHDLLSDHQENQQTRSLTQCIEKLTGTGDASSQSARNFKPSRLRMPSPKIGFFDEDKSTVLSASGGLQLHFGAQNVLHNINGTTNRKKNVKPQPARTSPVNNANIKSVPEETGMIHPPLGTMRRSAVRNQGLDKNSPKVSSTLGTLRNFPGKASKGQSHTSPRLSRENCLRSGIAGDGGHDTRKLGLHSSLKAESKQTDGTSKNEISRESKGQRICLRVSRIHSRKDEYVVRSDEDTNPTKKENKRIRGHHVEIDPHSPHKYERLSSSEDHVNGLNRYFELIDLNKDTAKELNRKKDSSNPNFGHNFLETNSAPISSTSWDYLQVSPNTLWNPGALSDSTAIEFIPSAGTPPADRSWFYNGTEPFGFTTESATEEVREKVSNTLLHSIVDHNS